MALEIYKDDLKTQAVLQENVFRELGMIHTLTGLGAADIQAIYKYSAGSYNLLAITDYTIVGTTLTLNTALVANEHIVVLPTARLNMQFAGSEGSAVSVINKLVFYKADDTTVYEQLKLYSEDLTKPMYYIIETHVGGIAGIAITSTNNILGSTGTPISGVGLVLTTNLTAYGLIDAALVINGLYIGDIIGHNTTTIVLASGTSIPTTGVSDTIEVYTTGNLLFALGTIGDVVPVEGNFKRFLNIPTLNMAAKTQYVWLKETAIIPGVTTTIPNMPFKLKGQTYTGV